MVSMFLCASRGEGRFDSKVCCSAARVELDMNQHTLLVAVYLSFLSMFQLYSISYLCVNFEISIFIIPFLRYLSSAPSAGIKKSDDINAKVLEHAPPRVLAWCTTAGQHHLEVPTMNVADDE